MAYHSLSECSLNDDERRAEADRIINIIAFDVQNLSKHEQDFVERMENGPVSVKQLFWLRDIKDKLN